MDCCAATLLLFSSIFIFPFIHYFRFCNILYVYVLFFIYQTYKPTQGKLFCRSMGKRANFVPALCTQCKELLRIFNAFVLPFSKHSREDVRGGQ